ncbi:hypothetical protein [Methanothrix soehngenii]|uniref:PIN domain-containing protein n=1 Tax=hydrocarbon metagenome TaxID=938273 RepID=A0A0W8F810_9ZZZZ|nr:hypothetical protein [Methanothrix soehngenii]HOS23450.1 hypothetical protein [Methanothrix soehngenii]HPL21715.1 hypothetical protein [Methanothrix soehngenii]
MSSPDGLCLVIDASVATSTGERGQRGVLCQQFLKIMIERTSHRLVMTKEIGAEWDVHSHPFARKWRRSMNAKKKVDRPRIDHDPLLAEKIVRANTPEKALNAMEKDLHLVEAARATDNRIVSLDDAARRYFCAASAIAGELRQILWVNPAMETERPIQWLEEGAPNEEERLIRPPA